MKTCAMTAKRTLRTRVLQAVSAFVCLLLLMTLIPAEAPADSGQKTVRVGWYESSFNRTDDAGHRSGYAYEYQMKIAAYAGQCHLDNDIGQKDTGD